MTSLISEAPVTPEPAGECRRKPRLSSPTRVTVTGCLVADPELRYSPTGVPVSRLQLATHGTEGTIVVGVVASPRRGCRRAPRAR